MDAYQGVLAELDQQIRAARQLAEPSKDWSRSLVVSKLLSRRARLTGRFEDWVDAERAMTRSFELAPDGGGPIKERAQLHLALHRVDDAEADLDRLDAAPLRTPDNVRAIELLRGDLAMQRGDLAKARKRFEKAHAQSPGPTISSRLALLERERGHFEQSLEWWDRAERDDRRTDADVRAWYSLQRGLVELARGHDQDALSYYDAAEDALPGWWLVAEHRAEVLANLGEEARARALYRRVVSDTGHPELLDALATLETGSDGQHHREQARAAHAARMQLFPAAARGHYIDHLLVADAKNPDLIGLTRAETSARPNAAAWAQQARAKLAVDRPREALDAIESALHTGACNVSLFETAEAVYRHLGDGAQAEAFETRRLRPDPCADPRPYPSQPP